MIANSEKTVFDYNSSFKKRMDVIGSELNRPDDPGKVIKPDFRLGTQKIENKTLVSPLVVRPFECYLCGLVFDRISQFDNHSRSVHDQERSQVCQICGKGFFRPTDLKTHLNIHLGTNRCMCNVCGRKFNHVSNLIRHSRTHSGVKPYPCSVCGKRFAQINTLARHKAIHKRGDEIMNCCFCDKKYKSDNGLREHMKKLHGFTEKSNPDDIGRIMKRKHYCKICGESFQFVEILRLHEETHQNLKSLECRSCNREFHKPDEIKEHRCRRQKMAIPNAVKTRKVADEESIVTIMRNKSRSNLSGENENVLKQLRGVNEDSKELKSNSNEIDTHIENSKINGLKDLIDHELDAKLSNAEIISSNKLVEDKQTKETIVYVTTGQLANMNTDQVVDTASHFLHQHLMELASENSLQTENISSRDCDGERVVSEMIKNCWKEIEMPDTNDMEICDKRDASLTAKNNTQSIIYIHALEKDGLIFLNEHGNLVSNVTPDIPPEKYVDMKNDSSSIKTINLHNELENSQTVKISQTDATSKRLASNSVLHENKEKNLREKNYKHVRAIRGFKNPNSRNCFSEDNSNRKHNLSTETTNPSLGSSDNKAPALRLVQTENGQQFYELMIPNNGSEKFENHVEFDRVSSGSDNLRAMENEPLIESLLKLVKFENGQRVLELSKNSFSDRTKELIEQKMGKEAENVDRDTRDSKLSETSVMENIEQDEMRGKNKCEKIFYLAQNNKDNNMIDFFEIETLGEQEQSSFNLAPDEAIENVSQTSFDHLETLDRNKSLGDDQSLIDNESCEELLGLIQSNTLRQSEKNKIESRKSSREDGPMVRLVQNEDGAQFFELIRGDLEFDETQDFELVETKDSDQTRNPQPSNDAKCSKKLQTDSGCAINESTKSGLDIIRKKRTKSNAKKYNCDVCKKSFSKGSNYRQHIGTHFADKQKFKCKECGTFFAWKSTLNKHMATHKAGGQQKFVCEICPKVYTTLSQVNEHVKRDHLKERNHKCLHCAKTFFKKFDLKIHIRTHTKERPYECRVCYKSFHHQSHIIRHERIHSGERPYACNICEKTFTQLGSLKNHRQRHQELKIDILDYQMDEDDPLPRTAF